MNAPTHSQRAVGIALEAMKPAHERTAIVVLCVGVFEAAAKILGYKYAAELAYSVADALALKVNR